MVTIDVLNGTLRTVLGLLEDLKTVWPFYGIHTEPIDGKTLLQMSLFFILIQGPDGRSVWIENWGMPGR